MVPEGERPWEKVPEGKQSEFAEASRLWGLVEASWDDEPRHEAYVVFLLECGLLDHGIQRYRHRVSDHPEDEISRRCLGQLVDRATAQATAMLGIAAHQARTVERQGRLVYNVLIVLVTAGLVLALWFALRMMRGASGGW